MERDEENALVARVTSGDRVAFHQLVMAHQRPLSAYARCMLPSADAADDVVQETLLRLWTQADRYEPNKARLTTWLHRIAHNLCIDYFRQNRQSQDINDDDQAGPEADYLASQQAVRVNNALKKLPERQRSALILTHYQGLSNKETAAIMALSVDALESLLRRARAKLKDALYEQNGERH